jgi:hypothetical protein
MILLDIRGRERKISPSKYRIEWDKERASAPQYRAKQFLKEFWLGDTVCEEFIIPGSRLRVDLINFSKMIAVEVSGQQHESFSKFFHKTRIGFIKSIKRDFQKIKWLESNNISLIELYDYETLDLSKNKIEKKFNISL